MHIIHVLPWLERGGTEGQVVNLSRRLCAAGHRVTVIAGEDGPWRSALDEYHIRVIIAPPYVHKGIHSRTGRISNIAAILFLARQFHQLKPDVVSAFLYPLAPLAMIAARLANVPVRLRNERDLGVLRAFGALPRWIERLSHRCTTRVVANSQAVALYLHQAEGIPRDAIEVVYNGVRPPPNLPHVWGRNQRRGLVVIGMLANFQPEKKDHLMLVRAARRVVQHAPHARFLLGGRSSPYRDQVQQAIQDWQLNDHVQIETVTDPADFLSRLDIGVLCSINEGFSNSVLEYMAYGKPVVGTRIPPLAEAIREGETGYLVEPGDDRALADVLLTLIRDPDLRVWLGQAGRQRVVDHFSWDRSFTQWIELFMRLLAEQRRV